MYYFRERVPHIHSTFSQARTCQAPELTHPLDLGNKTSLDKTRTEPHVLPPTCAWAAAHTPAKHRGKHGLLRNAVAAIPGMLA